MADLNPRVILPSHGPIPADPAAAFAAALRRAQRLVDDPAGAVWYGARRIFAFALMIRDGIPADKVEPYLTARAWLTDAARLLDAAPEALAAELVTAMLRSGATVLRDVRFHAAASHTSVAPETLRVPTRVPGRRPSRADTRWKEGGASRSSRLPASLAVRSGQKVCSGAENVPAATSAANVLGHHLDQHGERTGRLQRLRL
ncbi:hypothetical protein ACFYNF_32935 [Streptomyces sp. NPDC006641]|uniref:hypothetical protein n=1 Tax=unclassified Streptomyces TaxID=2593676 RepID=UPI00369FC8AA